jgi:hypothetical protein
VRVHMHMQDDDEVDDGRAPRLLSGSSSAGVVVGGELPVRPRFDGRLHTVAPRSGFGGNARSVSVGAPPTKAHPYQVSRLPRG